MSDENKPTSQASSINTGGGAYVGAALVIQPITDAQLAAYLLVGPGAEKAQARFDRGWMSGCALWPGARCCYG
jgi:hypothetical protein